ncbi:MAG: gliding motility protein GldL [Bacteroidota bacterium]
MNVAEIVQSSGWKNFMAKLYGLGASVVIVGALFKIQHWPGAGMMLTIGLTTEAVIFFFSAFEPLHEELDWTLVYPELAGMTDPDDMESYRENITSGKTSAVLERFDQIVDTSAITADDFNRLGDGLHKMNETASKISEITDASLATNNYVMNFQKAAEALGSITNTYTENTQHLSQSMSTLDDSYRKTADLVNRTGEEISEQVLKSGSTLTESYQKLTESIGNYYNNISSGGKNYGEQLESLNKNLAALNAVYELQLKENNDHLKGTQGLYSGFDKMMDNLKNSVEETQKYKEEISRLSDNLAALNTVYGNMLSAMNVSKK